MLRGNLKTTLIGVNEYRVDVQESKLAMNIEEADWRRQAACKGANGDLFYPKSVWSRESKDVRQQREQMAKRVCARCSVQASCLDWALRNGEVVGVWGGKTERERRALAKSSQKTATLGVG